MPYRTRVFIDFWNFSLQWRDRAGGARIDWTLVPSILLREGEKQLATVGVKDRLHLEETLVYASYASSDKKLKNWLDLFLDKQPSFESRHARGRQSPDRSIAGRAATITPTVRTATRRSHGRPRRALTQRS